MKPSNEQQVNQHLMSLPDEEKLDEILKWKMEAFSRKI
jgi:hypothetical protein